MVIKQTVAPAVEPLDLETEVKAHLRVDITDDDTLINNLVTSAREYIEEAAWRAFISQTWRMSLDEWPDDDEIRIPKPPLQSVSSIVYTDSDGTPATLSSSVYEVDTDSEPGRVKLAHGQSWPAVTLKATNPIQITFMAGYGDDGDSIPKRWKQVMLLLIGHWYENREVIVATGAVPKEIPLAVDSLIWLDRVF